jgi:hypothetical protein
LRILILIVEFSFYQTLHKLTNVFCYVGCYFQYEPSICHTSTGIIKTL